MSQATTLFDLYLHSPSLNSTGFPPEGGRTYNHVKDLLRSELKGHIIFEADLNIKYSAGLFHQLVPESSLKSRHITRIKYYGRNNGPPVYFQDTWNFNRTKKLKTNNQNDDSGSGNSDDESGTDTDIINTDFKVLDSQSSGINSEDMDGTWSRDEYDDTAEPGSKRGRKPSLTEKDLQCLFKAVQYTLRCNLKIRDKLPFQISNIERYWSAEFANSPIPDIYNAQKPNVALFYYKSKARKKMWADVLSFVEHTSSDFSKRRDLGVYWGSATKAYLIMREQPWRHFILSFSICAEQLHTHYCDCSGLIITLPTPIQSSPSRVADAIAAVSLVDLSRCGRGMIARPEWDTGANTAPKVKCTDERRLNALRRRKCGKVLKGVKAPIGVKLVYSDRNSSYTLRWWWNGKSTHQWTLEDWDRTCGGQAMDPKEVRRNGKQYMMKDCWVSEVKRYHEVDVLERVKGIPNVVQLIDHWDVLFNGEPDCTACIRDGYGVLLEDRPDKKFSNRYHQHLLLTPCGDPLWDFSSRKELICAFCDFMVAHEAMIKQQVLHGDLSPNNFIIHKGIGYFIDFDHASIIKEGETFTVSFGTDKTTMPWVDAYENLGATSSLLATYLVKKGAMSEGDILMDRVSGYFVEFKPIVDEWHTQIYHTESNIKGTIVHKYIFQMLAKFIWLLQVPQVLIILGLPPSSNPRQALPYIIHYGSAQAGVGIHFWLGL
ncbi:hypothetical protein F4604DRAFT_1689529 [Suillus subluteus]|nr:hypothetical protein F4604DRAFT_1689529 [Suillus subluteus]